MRNDDPSRRYGRRQSNFGEDDSAPHSPPDWSDRGHGEQYEQSPPFEDPHLRRGPYRAGNERLRGEHQGGGNYERMQYSRGRRSARSIPESKRNTNHRVRCVLTAL